MGAGRLEVTVTLGSIPRRGTWTRPLKALCHARTAALSNEARGKAVSIPKVCTVDGCPEVRPCRLHRPGRSPSSRVTSTSAWKHVRLEVLERDDWMCRYCGAPATTVDHVEPVAYGGEPLDPNKLKAACAKCNGAKSDKGVPVGRSTG